MNRIRVGMVGLGDIAQKVYLPLLTANAAVDIVGLHSLTPATVDRIGEQYRIASRFTRLEELLELQPDAMFVHSPTESHYDIVKACLERGVHVYVDKPLSYDYRESERLTELASERGLLLGVGFNRRFAPLYVEAKKWMEAGGGFNGCSVQKHRVRKQSRPARETVYDDLIHMLDLLLWLGGEEAQLSAAELPVDEEGRMVYASGCLQFGASKGAHEQGGTGASATYSMVRLAGRDLEKLELHGSGRSAEVINMETAQWSEAGGLPVTRTFGSWETVLERRGFAGVVGHFLACLQHPGSCEVSAERVLATHRLVERIVDRINARNS